MNTSFDHHSNISLNLDRGSTLYSRCNNTVWTARYRFFGISGCMILVGLWIIIANMMIISAPVVHKRLKRKTYMFISSLAAVDLTTAFLTNTAWFMEIIDVFNCELFQYKTNLYCSFPMVFYSFSLFGSICNMFLIALDRYVALVHPLKYDVVLTRSRSRKLIISVWVFVAAVSVIHLFWNNPTREGKLRCTAKDFAPGILYFVIGPCFWLTCIAMFCMYMRIYHNIRKRNSSIGGNIHCNLKLSVSDVKVAKMLFVSYTVFVVCWNPIAVCLVLLMESKVTTKTLHFPFFLAYLNSGMNFFIYVARSKHYQEAFKKMVKCCRSTGN